MPFGQVAVTLVSRSQPNQGAWSGDRLAFPRPPPAGRKTGPCGGNAQPVAPDAAEPRHEGLPGPSGWRAGRAVPGAQAGDAQAVTPPSQSSYTVMSSCKARHRKSKFIQILQPRCGNVVPRG